MKKQSIYRPDVKKIKNILNHPQVYTISNAKSLESLKKTVELMASQLKAGDQGAKEEEANQVKNALNFLLTTTIEKPVTPILRDLVNELIVLSASWNEAVAKRVDVREIIYTLRRLIDLHLSFSDLVATTKILIRKMEEIQRFSPPAFSVSEHYLRAIQGLESSNNQRNKSKAPRVKLEKMLNEEPPQC